MSQRAIVLPIDGMSCFNDAFQITEQFADEFGSIVIPKINDAIIAPWFQYFRTSLAIKRQQLLIDGKWNDIPNTLANYIKQVSFYENIFGITLGDNVSENGLEAVYKSAQENSYDGYIFTVTVLTSSHLPYEEAIKQVLNRARMVAKVNEQFPHNNSKHGIVCSAYDLRELMKYPDLWEMPKLTPGISLTGEMRDDQKRVETISGAIKTQKIGSAGAWFPVVGRPILRADNPLQVARELIQQLEDF